MAKALYRQYRPKTFDEVLGQDKVVNVLKNQIKNNNISHAYLFAGERGCGKTSCAKIFAKAVNCLNPKDGSPCLECDNCKLIDGEMSLDVVEMDAASNRRIDDIRNLKDNVIYPPSDLKYKVYIIDEAHMITREAFNALLKIMEEPPKHLIFILATTEIDKIPKTILSRVQKFEFNKIDSEKIKKQVNIILNDQKVSIENEGIDLIIRKARGAMRDALSILDIVLSFDKDKFSLGDIENILGAVSSKKLAGLVGNIIADDQKSSLKSLEDIRNSGKSNIDIIESLINFYRDMMILMVSEDEDRFENKERLKLVKDKLASVSLERILTSIEILNDYLNKLKYASNSDVLLDVLILRLIDVVNISSLESRVKRLERRNESNIIDLVNKLIDNRLNNIDFKSYDKAKKTVDEEIIDKRIIRDSSKKEEKTPSKDSGNEVKKDRQNDQSEHISSADIDKIKQMIVNSSGTMLNTLFNQEGFNYDLKGEDFTIYIKDEFYRIFIESKSEDIEKNLSEILSKKINFKLELASPSKKKLDKSKTLSKDHDQDDYTIQKLREIFSDDLIIK